LREGVFEQEVAQIRLPFLVAAREVAEIGEQALVQDGENDVRLRV
jgi:hypothetical protein